MKELLYLFLTFFKIGISTFGGGYAMLPVLQREIIEKKKWATLEELTNYYAVSQCTPGIISVNVSTFIGYKNKGIIGGIIATLGLILPSIIIILFFANLISTFSNISITKHIFNGVNICVSALIISAVLRLCKNNIKDKLALIIFFTILLLTTLFNLSPIPLVIISGILGLLKKEIKE